MPTSVARIPRFRQPRRPEGHSGVRRRRDDLDAGALLLREADRITGLTRQAAACFTDGRRQDRIEHRVETLIAQRIHGVALGYEDLNDHDELRHDPVLGLVSGKAEARRSDCAVLAGKSTLNRLEHAPKTDEDRYRKLSVDEGAMKRAFGSAAP